MDLKLMVVGVLVGLSIGLTGIGAGSILAPVLLFLGIPPASVVGSDLGYGLITKVVGGGVHAWKGTVRWRWVGLLSVGSIPGAILGSLLLGWLVNSPGAVRKWLGLVLVVTALLVLLTEMSKRHGSQWARRLQTPRPFVIPLCGFVIGLILGATSIGSGSFADLTLMLFSPLTGSVIVGTGLVHGVIVTGVAFTVHWIQGTVSSKIVLNLVLGSLPGVWLGSYLAYHSPTRPLKFGVALLILLSGLSMMR